MFSSAHRSPTRGERQRPRHAPAARLAVGGTALLLSAVLIAPFADPAAAAAAREARQSVGAQRVELDVATAAAVAPRDDYASELSPERMVRQLVGEGTQYDWARIVLYFGGWTATDDKVLAIVQWMRAENSPSSWWLRNNPLNNGYATFAGNFLSGYASLVDAAKACAAAIQRMGGYQVIEDALAADSTRDQVRAAIIASSWATGHYGGGAHWGGGQPTAVTAPASAWGVTG